VADTPAATGGLEPHDRHDPDRIASLLDRDLTDADRSLVEAQIAACEACAALHADLTSLANANLELLTPVRPRGFTLTVAQAAMLAEQAAGEPVGAGARLTGDMTDTRAAHAAHDRLLIASLVDRSISNSERALAEAQLASCRDCALLFDDLVTLSAATRALPVPTRSRDFALTRLDAERLQVRGWRRLLAAIGSSRDAFSRPLAFGLTTLGLAGLLVATVPSALTGQGSSTAALSTVGNVAGDAALGTESNPGFMVNEPSAAPLVEAAPGAAAALPQSPSSTGAPPPAPAASLRADTKSLQADQLYVAAEPSPVPGIDSYSVSLPNGESTGGSMMIVVAGLLLLAGLGLFGVRLIARRTRDG
jgi:hypothetical protein